MQIETFECQETAAEPIEASQEAAELIERLGLAGQRKFIVRNEATGIATRSPYRKITAEELFVYATLCPKQTRLDKYEDGPVPLRVLQVAAHAAEVLTDAPHLFVWHRAAAELKDPVLIAKKNDYDWDRTARDIYILARWGDELEALATLITRASQSVRARLVEDAAATMRAAEAITFSEMLKIGPQIRVEIH